MLNIILTASSLGPTGWVALNQNKVYPNAAVGVTLQNGSSLTYNVNHSYDNPYARFPCTITRSGTTATLTLVDHGLSANDSIVVSNASSPFDGSFNVQSVPDANTIIYLVQNSGSTVADSTANVNPMRVFTIGTLNTRGINGEYNYTQLIRALRINISAYTTGKATMTITQSG